MKVSVHDIYNEELMFVLVFPVRNIIYCSYFFLNQTLAERFPFRCLSMSIAMLHHRDSFTYDIVIGKKCGLIELVSPPTHDQIYRGSCWGGGSGPSLENSNFL